MQVNARYFDLRRTFLNQASLNKMIDSIANMVSEAQVRHFTKFNTLGYNNGAPEIDAIPTTFAGEIMKLKNWIATRIDWLDANMVGRRPSAVMYEKPAEVIKNVPESGSEYAVCGVGYCCADYTDYSFAGSYGYARKSGTVA